MSLVDLALVAATGTFAALAALWLAAWLPPRPAAARPPSPMPADAAAFVFGDDELEDASPAARLLLEVAPEAGDDLARLTALLDPWFPGLAARLAALPPGPPADFRSAKPPAAVLRARRGRTALRLDLTPAAGETLPLPLAILAAEARRFRDIAETAPLPVWCEDPVGRLGWANRAAARLAQGADPPLPDRPDPAAPGPHRQSLSAGAGAARLWFDRHDSVAPDGSRTVHALPADDAVRAEAALRGFLQTLTRSFAHLPIGLAVFDAEWRLSLFNPALGDLTGLPPAFLARRPTLHAVLDRLRELRMIPEPRDYAAWRRRLADIERVAESGHYTELWPLPSGQTFRVTGQPNAEGGVALLFENITADTARNRSLKARADLLEAAFGALDRAAAVFGPGGQMIATSGGWRDLWGEAAAAEPAATIDRCAALCQPTPFWAELRGGRCATPREDTVILRDGRVMAARLRPLSTGAAIVDFVQPPGLGTGRPGLGNLPGPRGAPE